MQTFDGPGIIAGNPNFEQVVPIVPDRQPETGQYPHNAALQPDLNPMFLQASPRKIDWNPVFLLFYYGNLEQMF